MIYMCSKLYYKLCVSILSDVVKKYYLVYTYYCNYPPTPPHSEFGIVTDCMNFNYNYYWLLYW